jgi:hypothetical protein
MEAFVGVELECEGSIEISIALEPYGMDSGPKIGEDAFQAACSLVFVLQVAYLLKV